jgi:hypothetical protein
MKWKKVDGCDVLLSEDPKTIQESIIDYILYLREERKIASSSISTNVAAIRKFYDCNDIELKWNRIKINHFFLEFPNLWYTVISQGVPC